MVKLDGFAERITPADRFCFYTLVQVRDKCSSNLPLQYEYIENRSDPV